MMANYGGMQNQNIQPGPSTTRTQPMAQTVIQNGMNQTAPMNQMQNQGQNQPNYTNWFGVPQNQPAPMTSEQRGITACYMVNSRDEYGYYSPIAGQTIAIFNFSENELCLKARDMYGIPLPQRTWDISETTQMSSVPVQQNQASAQQVQNAPAQPAEPIVTEAEFNKLKADFEALYKELKG